MRKYLYAIPHHTMYIDSTGDLTFKQDELYLFVEDGTVDDYVTTDERDDHHWADLEWLEENFEVYEIKETLVRI